MADIERVRYLTLLRLTLADGQEVDLTEGGLAEIVSAMCRHDLLTVVDCQGTEVETADWTVRLVGSGAGVQLIAPRAQAESERQGPPQAEIDRLVAE